MQTIGQRISDIKKFYFGDNRGSVSKFAEKVGENTNTVCNWFNRKDGIGNAVVNKILTAFPDVDRGWLIGGNGQMLKNGDVGAKIVPIKNLVTGVPYYDVDFIGGFDIVYLDQTVTPAYLIDFPPYNKATCWCNVTGHSMEPEINHGDMIALKLVEDFSFIPLGEIYAIVTLNDMRTIKRIGPSTKEDCYTLIPTNHAPEYGIQELRKDMIIKLYKVLGSVKRF